MDVFEQQKHEQSAIERKLKRDRSAELFAVIEELDELRHAAPNRFTGDYLDGFTEALWKAHEKLRVLSQKWDAE